MSLLLQRFGGVDPTCRWDENLFVKAFWTPKGPCTLALRQSGEVVEAEAVGPGAPWCEERLPAMFAFPPQELGECAHKPLKELSRRLSGLRFAPVPWPFDVGVAYIFQQRVQFREAMRCYRLLVERHGQAAPGPLPLRLAPSPEQWLRIGSPRLQAEGMDEKRAGTVMRLARLGLEFRPEQLAGLRGIGEWTLGSVKGYAFGDPDAVPVGDLHIPHIVCAYFGHHENAGDPLMLELLEPYKGVRFRVINWIMQAASARAYTLTN